MSLAAFLALAIVSAPAAPAAKVLPAGQAAPAGRAAPGGRAAGAGAIRVEADDAVYALGKRQVTFTGTPVTLTQDDAKLTCRRAVAQTDAGGKIVSALCQGEVSFLRGERRITCDRATFDAPSERLVCEGHPVLYDGGSVARGARLVYELQANEVRLEGEKGAPAVVTLPGAEIEARRRAVVAERVRRKAGQPERAGEPGEPSR